MKVPSLPQLSRPLLLPAVGFLALIVAFTRGAGAAGTVPAPLWDLAKDDFAATTGRIERVDGHVHMDGTSAFAIPNSALPDPSCFTIALEIRFNEIEQGDTLRVLDQRVTDTGFAVDGLKFSRVGSPLTTTINGVAFGQASFRASSNQVWSLVLAVRDGAVAVYQNGSAGPQYL